MSQPTNSTQIMTDFKVIYASSPTELENRVNILLRQGWQPHSQTVINIYNIGTENYCECAVAMAKWDTPNQTNKYSLAEMDNTATEELQRCATDLATNTLKPQITLADIPSQSSE